MHYQTPRHNSTVSLYEPSYQNNSISLRDKPLIADQTCSSACITKYLGSSPYELCQLYVSSLETMRPMRYYFQTKSPSALSHARHNFQIISYNSTSNRAIILWQSAITSYKLMTHNTALRLLLSPKRK